MGESREALVLAKCQEGEQEGFSQFFEMFRGYICSLCSRMSADQEDALDLYQESCLAIFRGMRSVRQGTPLKPWVRRVTLNVCLNEHRKRSSRLSVTTVSREDVDAGTPMAGVYRSGASDPQEEAESGEIRDFISRAVRLLNPDFRAVVILFHQEGLSYREIADVTGWPVGTVKTNLFRARKALAAMMSEWKVR